MYGLQCLHMRSHPMGPVGCVPSNFGEPGDQVYLLPSNFCDCHSSLQWVWRVNWNFSLTVWLRPARVPVLQWKLLDLQVIRGGGEWVQKKSGWNSSACTTTVKGGGEGKRRESTSTPCTWRGQLQFFQHDCACLMCTQAKFNLQNHFFTRDIISITCMLNQQCAFHHVQIWQSQVTKSMLRCTFCNPKAVLFTFPLNMLYS